MSKTFGDVITKGFKQPPPKYLQTKILKHIIRRKNQNMKKTKVVANCMEIHCNNFQFVNDTNASHLICFEKEDKYVHI